jgi:hypothetical protein
MTERGPDADAAEKAANYARGVAMAAAEAESDGSGAPERPRVKRGPKPLNESGVAMTSAERQARYRAAHPPAEPKIRYRRPADRRSRRQRWADAVGELKVMQGQYGAWLDNMPPSLRDGMVAEQLQAIVNLDLDEIEFIELPGMFTSNS